MCLIAMVAELARACTSASCKSGCCNAFGQCAESAGECSPLYECLPATCREGCCVGDRCGEPADCFDSMVLQNVLSAGLIVYAFVSFLILGCACYTPSKRKGKKCDEEEIARSNSISKSKVMPSKKAHVRVAICN